MRILLDTHVFLWWNEANPQLSRKAQALLGDPSHTLLLSVVSAWEIVVKVQAGRLRLPEPATVYIPTRAAHYGMEFLSLLLSHVQAGAALDSHHRDPFDRMLVAQAIAEDVPIMTVDPQIRRYAVKVLW